MSDTQKKPFIIPAWLKNVLILLIGFVFFVFILVNRFPVPFRLIAGQARYSLTIFAPAAFLLLFFSFKIKGYWGKLISFCLCMSLFALALSGLWVSTQTEPQVIGGLLPTVDAGEYYSEAQRLLNGMQFSDFGSRRPIFSSFLSSLLFFSAKNLQIILAVMVAFSAIACYLSSLEIRRRFGPLVAALFLLLLFYFYRRFSGKVMSENLGFILGVIGFTLLLSGIERKYKLILLFGIFLIALGLNVRAGPFFILVGLFIAVLILFMDKKQKEWKLAGLMVGIILSGFLISFIFLKLFGSSTGTLFSNFSYSLYGLVNNGSGWGQVFIDHPELKSLAEPMLSNQVYRFTFESFKANPIGLVTGSLKQYVWLVNFINSNASIFSFVSGDNVLIYNLTQIGLYVLTLLGLVNLWCNRKQPLSFFLLLALAGILISVPFDPLTDFSNMRVFAAVMPFLLVLPCIGFYQLTRRIPFFTESYIETTSISVQPVVSVAVIILVLALIVPVAFHFLIRPTATIGLKACKPGEISALVDLRPGTYLSIHPESQVFLNWVPDLHEIDFKQGLRLYSDEEVIHDFAKLTSPVILANEVNLVDGQDMFMIMEGQTNMPSFGKYQLCGNWGERQNTSFSAFFYTNSFFRIN